MSVSYPTFERLKERGLAAYKAGNYAEAKPFLMQPADTMIRPDTGATDPARRQRTSRWMNPLRLSFLLMMTCVALATDATGFQSEPSGFSTVEQARKARATKCISALPPSSESILIFDVEALSREDSILRHVIRPQAIGSDDQNSDARMTFNRFKTDVRNSKPLTWAWGGSRFSRDTGTKGGIGIGKYSGCWIWICGDTTAPLKLKVEELVRARETGVSRHEIGGATLFSIDGDESPRDKAVGRVYVSFSGVDCICAANNLQDCAAIWKRLRERQSELPYRWHRVIDSTSLSNVMLLARIYDPNQVDDFYSPIHFVGKDRWEKLGIKSIVLTLTDPTEARFDVACVAMDPDAASSFYKMRHFPDSKWEWDTKLDNGGFRGVIRAQAPENAVWSIFLTFGLNIFI